jgi:hypothetical protein
VSKSARFGPVQVEFRDDGSLFIYQPEPNLVLGRGKAGDLVDWLMVNYEPMNTVERIPLERVMAELGLEMGQDITPQATVPAGVINTSAGPTELTDTEQEQDRNAAEARAAIERGIEDVEQGRVKPLPEATKPAPRRRGRPPKAKS